MAMKHFVAMFNSLGLSSPHPLEFQYVSDLSAPKNVRKGIGHKLKLTYLYACWIMYIWHHLQIMKIERRGWPEDTFNVGEVWNPVYVAMGIKLLSPNCIELHLVESYCKVLKHF